MSSSNNAYWRHYTSAHCVEAGDVAWGDLARSSALNDLDTSAVAADAMRANAFALPVEIKSIIGAAHELADSPRRDHWGLRQLAAARLGGHLPEHLRPPESDWSLIGSSLTTQPLHRTLTGHTRSVYSVAFGITPTGQLLLATASYETIRIWAPTTGTPLHTLTGHTDWVTSVAFGATPTGQLLLAT
ncbi:MAG TPA: hypothetical protein PKE40_05100, partial [Arachnia sp.]|nr:hypothetical protein [Arachnia sp.]